MAGITQKKLRSFIPIAVPSKSKNENKLAFDPKDFFNKSVSHCAYYLQIDNEKTSINLKAINFEKAKIYIIFHISCFIALFFRMVLVLEPGVIHVFFLRS